MPLIYRRPSRPPRCKRRTVHLGGREVKSNALCLTRLSLAMEGGAKEIENAAFKVVGATLVE